METSWQWVSSAITDKGNVRKANEDAILDRPQSGLWVVADGMGGHEAGEVASGAIVAKLAKLDVATRVPSIVSIAIALLLF